MTNKQNDDNRNYEEEFGIEAQTANVDKNLFSFWCNILEKSRTSANPHSLGPGNPFQAACAFIVLGSLSQSLAHMSSGLGQSLLQKLIQSSFRRDIVSEIVERCLCKNQNFAELVQYLVEQATPAKFYGVAATRLLHKKNLLQSEIERWNSLEATMQKELLKKQMLMEKTAKQWQRSLLTSMFRVWKNVTLARKKQRELLNHCFARVSKTKAKQIFIAWKNLTADAKRTRALNEMREIDARYSALQASKRELDTLIKRAADDVSEWNERLNELHNEMAELRGQIEENREDAEPQLLQHTNAKRVASAWFSLCDTIILLELQTLESQLNEISHETFIDLELLVQEATDLDSLMEMPVNEILLRWVRFHVPNERVENFATDMADGEVLWKLLCAIKPPGIDLNAIENRCNGSTLGCVLEAFQSIPTLNMINMNIILTGTDDVIYCILSYLFCSFPALSRPQPVWEECRKVIKEAALAQETLADYVARNSIYDLRHETTWLSLVNRTEETRRKVRWCIRERDQKVGLWNNVHKRVQSVGWVLLLERLRGNRVEVPNHKEARLLAEFTVVSGYSPSKREDEAVSTILATHYEIIKTAYYYYAIQATSEISPRDDACMRPYGLILFCRDTGLDSAFQLEKTCEILRLQCQGTYGKISPHHFVRCLLSMGDTMFQGLSPAANLSRLMDERISSLRAFLDSQVETSQELAQQTGRRESMSSSKDLPQKSGATSQGGKHASMRRRKGMSPQAVMMNIPTLNSSHIRLRRVVWQDESTTSLLRSEIKRIASAFGKLASDVSNEKFGTESKPAGNPVDEFFCIPLKPFVDKLKNYLSSEASVALEDEVLANLRFNHSSSIFLGDFCELLVAICAFTSANPLVPFPKRFEEFLQLFFERIDFQSNMSQHTASDTGALCRSL